jgi:2-oxoacid:acceptor oxidoreductase delta subunit (pyruvate/2-ketoisovalerate family)
VPDPRPIDDVVHGVPPVVVSTTSTRVNHTGSWKYIRPVYQDRVAPCNQGCPVGVDIEGCMNLLREGRQSDAIDLLLRENPLPAVTGRVCYHPCERACNRAKLDDAVAIHAVERHLGDLALEQPAPQVRRVHPESVAVVGSGPAGLACAYHLARLGYGVTIYEAEDEPGGVLRYGIPEYRLPKRVLAQEVDRLRAMGVAIRCRVRVGREVTFGELDRHAAVFVATGTGVSRALGIPGEDAPGVLRGIELLRAVNRGQRPELGRQVVVIGGGNTAMDCARTAVRLGAEVSVLYRRGRAEMPANAEEVQEALHEGVRFGFLTAPVAVKTVERVPGDDGLDAVQDSFDDVPARAAERCVVGLTCVRMRLGEPDPSGRRAPEPIPGSEFFVPAETVVTALGEDADLGFLPRRVERRAGVVKTGPLGATPKAAVFAGGDIVEQPHTVAFAIGSGKRAALGIDRYLRTQAGERPTNGVVDALRWGPDGNVSAARWTGQDPVQRVNPVNEVADYESVNPAHFPRVERHDDRQRPTPDARHGFDEVNLGLPPDHTLDEARRCFNCGVCNACELCLVFCPDVAISRNADGRFDIAYEYCKGCGVCAEECPRGAITMTREGL